jgi:hypothetical protein
MSRSCLQLVGGFDFGGAKAVPSASGVLPQAHHIDFVQYSI